MDGRVVGSYLTGKEVKGKLGLLSTPPENGLEIQTIKVFIMVTLLEVADRLLIIELGFITVYMSKKRTKLMRDEIFISFSNRYSVNFLLKSIN